MKKEIITLDAVKQDFIKIAEQQLRNQREWRLFCPIPYSLLAIILGVLLENPWIALAIFSIPLYHLVRFFIWYAKYRKKKAAILALSERRDLSVTNEHFSHIAVEKIYEPFWGSRHIHYSKPIRKYYFRAGSSWREMLSDHYSWSSDFCMSAQGLENISVGGDEYFFITFREHTDIAYIYPCDYFVLDQFLLQRVAD